MVLSKSLAAVAKEAMQGLEQRVCVVVDADRTSGDADLDGDGGWRNSAPLLHRARESLHRRGQDLESLKDQQLVALLWQLAAPIPVESSSPLFILYTSGSTGKPKGIVHTHGGYLSGICATAELVLGVQPGEDVLLVLASPGWITGQSYMISAALLMRVTSVLFDGSPLSPPDRVGQLIALHKATILKAGSTFVRMLMSNPRAG